jgi:predicted Zn-dependent peptidase
MTRRFAAAALLFAAFALAAAAPAAAQGKSSAKAPKRPTEGLRFGKLNPITMPTVVRETLPNGMKVILVEDHDLPLIEMRALVRGGTSAEPKGKRGLAELFGDVHRTGGTKSMAGDKVDEFLERIGASIETSVNETHGSIYTKTLTDTLDQVLPLFAEYLSAPEFTQDKIDLGKTHMNGVISRRNDEVMSIAQREILKLIYGADSPYARQFEYSDVAELEREDLLAFHKAYYRPDQTVFAVWGDFKTDEMKGKLAKAFGGWKAEGPAPEYPPPFIFPAAASVNYIEKKDVEQTTLILGQLGMRLDDPDYPAVQMMTEILGGGFSSRLFKKVRTEKGLAYGAGGAMVPAYDHDGAFYFYTATKPASTADALGTVLDEIQRIRKEQVTDAELQRAKEGYLNSYAFEFDSTGKIVNRMLTYDFHKYPADFNVKLRDAVEKVTKEDILRVAQTRLLPDKMTIVAVGKQEEFDKPLSTFGKVNTIDITIPEPKSKESYPEPIPETLARGKELLLKAAKAAGEQALKGVKDVSMEGSNSVKTPMGPMELKGKGVFVLPDRLFNDVTTPMGTLVQVLDGDKAWMTMAGQTQDLPGSAVAEMRKGLLTDVGGLLLLQQALAGKIEAQALGKAEFEGKSVESVLLRLPGGTMRLYLGDDGLILGTRQMAKTQEGPQEVTEAFGNWQTVQGLKIPFEKTETVKGEVEATTKLTSVKINAGFSPDIFKKPEPAPEKK